MSPLIMIATRGISEIAITGRVCLNDLMSASRSKGIITKSDWWISGILGIAALLRLFRIGELTEFLGDQGRTLLILHDWVTRGVVPIAGPTTLSGHHLGPFFYYLLFPAYTVFPGPFSVSVWMAVLGVASVFLLYSTVRMVYGRYPALAAALLYAVSPAIVRQDRIIWEPNLVPLFGILFAWLAIRQHDRLSIPIIVLQGAVCGILVQLHYPNVFFIGLLGLVGLGHSVRIRTWAYLPRFAAGWLLGFLIVMAPFLYYETMNGYRDILGIGRVFIQGSAALGKRQILLFTLDYAHRIVGFMLPGITMTSALVLFAGWCVFLVRHFTSWNIFWTVWFVFGAFAMGRYNGVVHDHYLFYLLPVPFLMLGSVLSVIRKDAVKLTAILAVLLISGYQVSRSDVFTEGTGDISRVYTAVAEANRIAGDRPYSFTLINSRSFSDLHYRYVMETSGTVSRDVTEDSYNTFLLLCDSTVCPADTEAAGFGRIGVLCYDHHCSGAYPTIALRDEWMFERSSGGVYVFTRRAF